MEVLEEKRRDHFIRKQIWQSAREWLPGSEGRRVVAGRPRAWSR